MRIVKIGAFLVLSLLGLFILFLLVFTILDYRPPEKETLYRSESPDIIADSVFRVCSWNLGFAGLDSLMDFFYDGGTMVRPEEELVERNIEKISTYLRRFRGIDFYLLQEVDVNSKRSYGNNMYTRFEQQFKSFHSSFGTNYKVGFVPVPLTEPMGKVFSGLQTISLYAPESVDRYSFPGNYAWPKNLFMLDRCFLVNRYPMAGGKEMIIINTHNSAYDDGSLRKKQLDYLRTFLLNEYAAGNYVIVGGDWNMSPPGFVPEFREDVFDTIDVSYIPENYPDEDWQWAYDPAVPTNRRLMEPYVKGETPTTVIDFFLLSPNLELQGVNGRYLKFAYSDHSPVFMRFKIR